MKETNKMRMRELDEMKYHETNAKPTSYGFIS